MGLATSHQIHADNLAGNLECGSAVAAGQNREIPRIGQSVEIDDRDGMFVVLRTDIVGGTVDVLQMSGVRQIEGGVPLERVRLVKLQNPMQPRSTAD